MKTNAIRKAFVGAIALAGVFVNAPVRADTFTTRTNPASGQRGDSNGQCFVEYLWTNAYFGATWIEVCDNNGAGTCDPSVGWSNTANGGMAYYGDAEVLCSDNRIYVGAFNTDQQDAVAICPFGTTPSVWGGEVFSLQSNGCVF